MKRINIQLKLCIVLVVLLTSMLPRAVLKIDASEALAATCCTDRYTRASVTDISKLNSYRSKKPDEAGAIIKRNETKLLLHSERSTAVNNKLKGKVSVND